MRPSKNVKKTNLYFMHFPNFVNRIHRRHLKNFTYHYFKTAYCILPESGKYYDLRRFQAISRKLTSGKT